MVPAFSLRKVLPFLVLGLGAGGFLVLKATRPAGTPVATVERAWPVATVVAERGPHRPHLDLLGRVESPLSARLAAAVAAEVEALHVLEGQTVAPGILLVSLDDRDYRLTLAQREAELAEVQALLASEEASHQADLAALEHDRSLLALAQRGVQRARDLNARQVGTEAGLDDALEARDRQRLSLVQRQLAIDTYPARRERLEAQLERVRAQVARARLDLERAQVRAPFRGRVAETRVAPGDRVKVGDPLVELFSTEHLEVRAQLPGRHEGRLVAALEAGETLRAQARFGDRTLELTLDRLAARVERGSGGVDALFRIPGAAAHLPLGQPLAMTLDLPPAEETLALPVAALYEGERVYRIVDGRLEAVEVERVGRGASGAAGTTVLVRSARLRDGDRLVATQLPNAVTGLKVRPADPAVALAPTPAP